MSLVCGLRSATMAPMNSPTPAFDVADVHWHSVSPRLISVRVVSVLIFMGLPTLASLVPAIVFGGWTWTAPAGLVLLTLWLLWLIPRQVRAIGYAEQEEDLMIRKGVLFRSLTVVPYGRMQYVDVGAGPIARKMKIAQVQLHTASAQTDASIPGLPEDEAGRLRDQLSARGEAKLAGL